MHSHKIAIFLQSAGQIIHKNKMHTHSLSVCYLTQCILYNTRCLVCEEAQRARTNKKFYKVYKSAFFCTEAARTVQKNPVRLIEWSAGWLAAYFNFTAPQKASACIKNDWLHHPPLTDADTFDVLLITRVPIL